MVQPAKSSATRKRHLRSIPTKTPAELGDNLPFEHLEQREDAYLWTRKFNKLGIIGMIGVAAIAMAYPIILTFLSGIGLGFMSSPILAGLLMGVFAALALLGLVWNKRKHRQPWALVIGLLSASFLAVFLFAVPNNIFLILGTVGLIAANLWDAWLASQSPDLRSQRKF